MSENKQMCSVCGMMVNDLFGHMQDNIVDGSLRISPAAAPTPAGNEAKATVYLPIGATVRAIRNISAFDLGNTEGTGSDIIIPKDAIGLIDDFQPGVEFMYRVEWPEKYGGNWWVKSEWLVWLTAASEQRVRELEADKRQLREHETGLRNILNLFSDETKAIWEKYQESDDPCPYCHSLSDEPHNEDCVMLDLHWFLDDV